MARAFVAAVVLMAYGVSVLVETVQASEAKRVIGRLYRGGRSHDSS